VGDERRKAGGLITRPYEGAAKEGPLLRCEQLVIGYGGRALLPPIELEVARGSLVAVVGRNGAGKSTWLRTVLGLLPQVAGRCALAHPQIKLAYVPQATRLDPALPVRAREVVLWSRLRGLDFLRPWARANDRRAVDAALAAAGALDFADQPLRDLSEGQKQRVYFARMLAAEADVALLDEPTAAMDAVAERDAFEQLAALARENHMAIVVISHALDVAAQYASQVLFLDREHDLALSGAPGDVLAHPGFVLHYGPLGGSLLPLDHGHG
jgi:zinc transport system ATP-binding protein